MASELLANIVIKGKIEVLTGLHIGGSKEKIEIGGVDSPVIRDPFTDYPYIPGSSIKGKMRMLTEFALGKISSDGKPYEAELNETHDEITRIFGTSKKGVKSGPTRLLVRDAYPDTKTIDMWKNLNSELQFTELKPENTIDRLTSEANPRFIERVVKGSCFNFEVIYSIYKMEGDEKEYDVENFSHIANSFKYLEHSGLGGNISRGYGRIKFSFAKPLIVTKDEYLLNGDEYKRSITEPEDTEYTLTSAELAEININIG